MSAILSGLAGRLHKLELAVENQAQVEPTATATEFTERSVHVGTDNVVGMNSPVAKLDQQTQTDGLAILQSGRAACSYSDALKATNTQPAQSGKKEHKRPSKHDVKTSIGSGNVKSDVSGNPNRPKRDTVKPRSNRRGFPVVGVFHDSVLNGVHAQNLGESFGLDVFKVKTPDSSSIPSSTQQMRKATGSADLTLDAVVLHCGVNDIRASQDPKAASEKFVRKVKELKATIPTAKVVISRIPPVKLGRDSCLQASRDLFNAFVFSDLKDEPAISFVSHESLRAHAMRDSIHPNQRGSFFLARNIGQHLEGLLWTTPRRAGGAAPAVNRFSDAGRRQQPRGPPWSGQTFGSRRYTPWPRTTSPARLFPAPWDY
jgi:hypothetical protein